MSRQIDRKKWDADFEREGQYILARYMAAKEERNILASQVRSQGSHPDPDLLLHRQEAQKRLDDEDREWTKWFNDRLVDVP